MNYYAHFFYDIPNSDNTAILFEADSKYHNKNKYAVIDEDKTNYYIAIKPNDINCNEVCKFSKLDEDEVFFLMED